MFKKIIKRRRKKNLEYLIKNYEEMLKDLKAQIWDIDHDDPKHPIYDEWFVKLLNRNSKEELRADTEELIERFEKHKKQLEQELWDL